MSNLSISLQEFSRLITLLPIRIDDKIGLAISGGPDSMALAHLMHAWAKKHGVQVHGFHVDHQLRPSSSLEAASVVQWLAEMDISCDVLVWHHGDLRRKTQAHARQARHVLIAELAKKKGITQVFLGHHLNDQIETFLLRLECGSGVSGLSGMQSVAHMQNLTLLRPLLTVPKKKLQEAVIQKKLPFIDDPSNHNEEFARVRMRKLAHVMQEYGFDPGRLGRTVSKISETNAAMSYMMHEVIDRHATYHDAGYISVAATPLDLLPKALVLRVLDGIIRGMSGQLYPVRYQRLARCYDKLIKGDTLAATTLGHCYIKKRRKTFLFCREAHYVEKEITLRTPGQYRWDERFWVDLLDTYEVPSGITVGPLGYEGWKQISTYCRSDLPSYIVYTLPAIWLHNRVIAQPHLGFGRVEWLRISFAPDIL